MLPTKFQVNWPFSSKKKGKIDFQDGHHLGFPIETILAILISSSHPDASYQIFKSTGPLVQENKRKKEFQDGRHGGHLGISDPNNLSYFRSTSHPNASYQVSSQMAFQFRRKSEKQIFKMAVMAATLDF